MSGLALDEMSQQAPLVRFGRLTLVKAGVIRAAGVRLEPTGRNPPHFDITFDQLGGSCISLVSWCPPSQGPRSGGLLRRDP